ncbi:hypothetical protein KI387_016425, partial [Taxus chinensis]
EIIEMEKYWGIICLCILMTVTVSAHVSCFPYERDALLSFMNSVNPNSLNWKGFNCCEWSGVECSKYTSHVTTLDLAGIVQFSLPFIIEDYSLKTGNRLVPDLFQLKSLEYLDLSGNYFQGSLPTELFSLRKLRHLYLSGNSFEGEIPKNIGSLHSLTYLRLDAAGFTGRIPWQLGNLSQLQFLDLSYPAGESYSSSLGWTENLRELQYLDLSRVVLNMTDDRLEASISHLHNLHDLYLSDCSLSGRIPNSIQNLTFLSHLYLAGNDFSSNKMPSWLENMTSLVSLNLMSYNFSGPFSLGFSAPPRLEELKLGDTQFSGDISQILCGQWPRLTSFSLHDSSVKGSMPPCIGNLSALQHLDLQNNLLLTGEIPTSFRLLRHLYNLDLSFNNLHGNFSLDVLQS